MNIHFILTILSYWLRRPSIGEQCTYDANNTALSDTYEIENPYGN